MKNIRTSFFSLNYNFFIVFIILFSSLLVLPFFNYIFASTTVSWTTRSQMPTPRGWMPAVSASNGKMYVIGGQRFPDNSIVSTNEEYDPNSNSWLPKASMPSLRLAFGAAELNGKIYVFGGVYGSNRLNSVLEYNALTNTWSSRASMPTAREGLVAVSGNNGKIYAIGGYNGQLLNIVEEYDPITDTWSSKANMPTARYGLGVAALKNKIYAIGGYGYVTPYSQSPLNVVEEFDTLSNSWEAKINMPTSRMVLGVTTGGNGKIYAIGGDTTAGGVFTGKTEEATVVFPNITPSVDADGPYEVNEGETVQVAATGSDPENGPLTYAWDLDNNGTFEILGQTVTFSATNLDGPDSKIITVQVTDDGNLTAIDQTIVNITNVTPTVGPITAPTDPILVNTQINTNVSFTDPGVPDTHTGVWEWGDNLTSAGTVDQQNDTVTGSHTYTIPGVYEVKVNIADDDEGIGESIYQFIVVYDNSASGGFVTGAGVIDSPVGSYVPNSSLTGIAKFGFVSKYQPGASTPTGNTQFKFQAADFTFTSTVYQWLVVAGAQAKFKGDGTVNGSGSYGFQLSAIDGSINGGGGVDKFRIKIWDENNNDQVVYDNNLGSNDNSDPTTELTGGNIV